jgi:predicted ribosomally synthesized peptide with SipW-like signal peptide
MRLRLLKTMRRPVRFIIGASVAVALGLGTGTAYAYWSSTHSGSGSATTGNVQAVTLVAAAGTVSSKLIPGTTADLSLELNNPNSYTVTITGIAQNGSVTVVGGTGCTATGVTVPTKTGLSVTVASGNNAVAHIPNGASMDATSDSGCQGSSFHVPVTLTVQR